MGRHSFKWVWAVVGVAAIAFIVISGLNRRAKLTAPAAPPPTQPIIVEPIQPSAPALPVGPQVGPGPAATSVATTPASPTVEVAAVSAATALPKEGTERIKKIQQALQAAGYNPGPVDGKMGHMTQKAIRDFQEAQGLSVDGKVGPKTWSKLDAYLHTTATTSASHD